MDNIERSDEHLRRICQNIPRMKSYGGKRSRIEGCGRRLIEADIKSMEVIRVRQLLGHIEEPAAKIDTSACLLEFTSTSWQSV